jgi:hypothetical protein
LGAWREDLKCKPRRQARICHGHELAKISPLVSQAATRHAPGMESHEWFENTDEGKVYYRANYIGTRWTIMTTMQKRDPTWTDIKPVPEAIWRELRELVWKKYQRKRCPWERVADLDKMLGDDPPAK